MSRLDKLAYRVICPVQAHCVQYQVMGLRFQVQRIVISDDCGLRITLCPEIGKTCHDRDRCKGSVNLVQSLLQFIGGVSLQEQCVRQGAGAVARKGCAVGDLRHIHADHLGCIHAVAKRHSGNLSTAVRGLRRSDRG